VNRLNVLLSGGHRILGHQKEITTLLLIFRTFNNIAVYFPAVNPKRKRKEISLDRNTVIRTSGSISSFQLQAKRVKLDGTVKKRQMQSPKWSRAYGAAYSAKVDSATKAGRAREANQQEMVFAVCLAP
jgi:hypothetical protein